MKVDDDYIPVELWREAKQFIADISDDVKIFRQFCVFEKNIEDEASKFAAWWNLERYTQKPHSLILIYESLDKIYDEVGQYDVLDGFAKLQKKLVLLYRLLKDNGMTDE